MTQGEPILVAESPSAGGLSVFASVGPPRQPIVPDFDPTVLDWAIKPKFGFLNPRVPHLCGHIAPIFYQLRVYGRTVVPSTWRRRLSRCPDCQVAELRQVVIRCCLCGLAILPGDPVAIYDAESVERKDFAITVTSGGGAVGCLFWDCCPSGGFFSGHWNGNAVDYLFD